jgi:uncharacterized membrane protein YkoI
MKPFILALPALLIASAAWSAEPTYHRDIPADLAKEAKISEDAALTTARAAIPNGKVMSIELEREKGQLLYSVDIKAPKKQGVEEIHVSAVNGQLLSKEHESARTELKEAAAEKNEVSPKSQK